MFESDLFRFAELMDSSFINRLSSSDSFTPEDMKKANLLEQHASTLLEVKTEALHSLSRNMADSTETEEPTANDSDRMNVWTMVGDELKAIRDLQYLIKRLNHCLAKGPTGGDE